MQPSSDVKALVERFYEAFSSGDADLAASLMSAQPGILMIGSDPGEWLEDIGAVKALVGAQAGAGITVRADQTDAYEEGAVGWAAGRGAFEIGSEAVPFRMTVVARREADGWKCVQAHASVAVANEEAIGVSLD